MKQVLSLAVAVAMVLSSVAIAEEMKSGLAAGEGIGAFYVTKCAGEEADNVEIGKNLCYRCRNGSRPQVMVFTRSTDEKVIALLKKLDVQLKKYEDDQLRAFVNVLGESKDAATKEAEMLAKKADAKSIPFVVPNEFENGPEDYGINPKAEITIILANESKVVGNFAASSAKDLDIDAVLNGVAKMFN